MKNHECKQETSELCCLFTLGDIGQHKQQNTMANSVVHLIKRQTLYFALFPYNVVKSETFDKYFPNCGIVQFCRVTTLNCVHRDFLSGLLAFILHLPCLFSIGKFIMTISSTSQLYCFCFLYVMVLFWISLLIFPVAARFTITHFPILSTGISISKFLPSAGLLARLPLSLKLTHQFFILHGHCC